MRYPQWSQALKKVSLSFPKEHFAPAVQKVAHDALRSIVFYSPVGNPSLWANPDSAPPGYVGGHFRNNWFVQVSKSGVISPSIRNAVDSSGAGSLSEESKLSVIKEDPFVVIRIHNSLPYAVRLEEGHSTQAPGPASIVGRTFNDLINTVKL